MYLLCSLGFCPEPAVHPLTSFKGRGSDGEHTVRENFIDARFPNGHNGQGWVGTEPGAPSQAPVCPAVTRAHEQRARLEGSSQDSMWHKYCGVLVADHFYIISVS